MMTNVIANSSELDTIEKLYNTAESLVVSDSGTLVISGSAEDLALIERVLLRLQFVKGRDHFRESLERIIETPIKRTSR